MFLKPVRPYGLAHHCECADGAACECPGKAAPPDGLATGAATFGRPGIFAPAMYGWVTPTPRTRYMAHLSSGGYSFERPGIFAPAMYGWVTPTPWKRYSERVRLSALGQCQYCEPCRSRAKWCRGGQSCIAVDCSHVDPTLYPRMYCNTGPCLPLRPATAPGTLVLPPVPAAAAATPRTTPITPSAAPGAMTRAEFDAFVSAMLQRQTSAENLLKQLQITGATSAPTTALPPGYAAAPGAVPAEEAAMAAPAPSGTRWWLWIALAVAAGGGVYMVARRRRGRAGRARGAPRASAPPAPAKAVA